MAHFHFDPGTPNLPSYLFEADLEIAITKPQDYSVIPIKDGRVYLRWLIGGNTTYSATEPLYTEVYRSDDLEAWTLITTLTYPTADYYDSDVLANKIYYYRVRFVRKDNLEAIANTSSYTVPLSAKVVTLLGFEPQDAYSNKFLQTLISSLPGTKIYDHTPAGTFSAGEYLWQTTSQMLDGFSVTADGGLVANEDADSAALYSKRTFSFFLGKKFTQLYGNEKSTGVESEHLQVNTYLLYTFLYAYAKQFMALYEGYLQIVADKFIDYSQLYTKGFKPVVSGVKDASLADLYLTFGKFLNIKPTRSQTTSQGYLKYRELLKNSFSNVENMGKVGGIHQAAEDTLGISEETLFEHNKFHWFKSDRELKLYAVPSATDPINMTTNLDGLNNDLIYTTTQDDFTLFVQYVDQSNGIPWGGAGSVMEYMEVMGSSGANPYQYLFDVHISNGATTANDVKALMAGDPIASTLMSVANSGAVATGLVTPMVGQMLTSRTNHVGWEQTGVKLHGRTFNTGDVGSKELGTDTSNMSRVISAYDPTSVFDPTSTSLPANAQENVINIIGVDKLVIQRDDNNEGAGYYEGSTPKDLIGDKKSLIKISMTPSGMTWVTKATLTLRISVNTNAGYIRLYRLRKSYDTDEVCWNYRDKTTIAGYNYIEGNFVSSTVDWVTKEWEEGGASGATDNLFLKEFYIPQISSDTTLELDITEIVQDIYKYESAYLDLGNDPTSILKTGFMLSAEAMPNKSMMVFAAHSDVTYSPRITWEKLGQGYYSMGVDETTYFYVDGTTRYGKLLVMQSDREPVSYNKTVSERIRQDDIKMTSEVSLTLSAMVPSVYPAGKRIYGLTSKAVGKITSIGNNTLFVDVEISAFDAGEDIRLLDAEYNDEPLEGEPVLATISSTSYTGNKYVRLSRTPIQNSIVHVYHTGTKTTATDAPLIPDPYAVWTEGGDGIEPVFVSATEGTNNIFASRDTESTDLIYLNTADSVATIGDVIITYQYTYEFYILGRARTDNQGIIALEGCSRLNNHMYAESNNDWQYKAELMLPMPSTGDFVETSGDSLVDEYSDYNLGVLCDAVSNIRRANGKIDVFKYNPQSKPYRFNQLYGTFFRKA